MGTFSPSPFYTKEVEEFCNKYVYQATVDAMKAEGRPFKGVIFFGLMLTEEGPKVLEYNARFGDPEAQVVLPRMKNDIIEVVEACIDGTLDQVDPKTLNPSTYSWAVSKRERVTSAEVLPSSNQIGRASCRERV